MPHLSLFPFLSFMSFLLSVFYTCCRFKCFKLASLVMVNVTWMQAQSQNFHFQTSHQEWTKIPLCGQRHECSPTQSPVGKKGTFPHFSLLFCLIFLYFLLQFGLPGGQLTHLERPCAPCYARGGGGPHNYNFVKRRDQ